MMEHPLTESTEGVVHLPSPSRAATTRSVVVRILQLALGLGVLAWLLLSGAIQWNAVRGLLGSTWVLPVAALLQVVNLVFTAWRLRVLMEAQNLPLPFWSAFRLAYTAAFFSWCIPGGTGGDLVKMYYLGRWYPGKVTEAVTVTLWDRAVGLATFLMLALMAAAFVPSLVFEHRSVAALLGMCLGLLLVGGLGLGLALWTDWSRRWPLSALARLGRPGQTLIRVFHVVHAYRKRPQALFGGIGLSLCAQVCLLGITMAVATVVTAGGAKPIMLVLLPMGWVTNALPLSPGGLGVGEAAQEELFKLVGLSGGAAVSLSWRAVAMVVSLPGLWFYLRSRRPETAHAPDAAPGPPLSQH